MMRLILALMLLTCVTSIYAQESKDLPKGPSPLLVTAVIAKDSKLLITRLTSDKPETTYQSQFLAVKAIRFFGSDGKEIDLAKAVTALQKPTAVLLSSDGKPVDPHYLRMFKEGTLVLVGPENVQLGPKNTQPKIDATLTAEELTLLIEIRKSREHKLLRKRMKLRTEAALELKLHEYEAISKLFEKGFETKQNLLKLEAEIKKLGLDLNSYKNHENEDRKDLELFEELEKRIFESARSRVCQWNVPKNSETHESMNGTLTSEEANQLTEIRRTGEQKRLTMRQKRKTEALLALKRVELKQISKLWEKGFETKENLLKVEAELNALELELNSFQELRANQTLIDLMDCRGFC